MKLTALRVENYRTIEEMTLQFGAPYVALCGANDSGKSNVVRAIRILVGDYEEGRFYQGGESPSSVTDDYPKWKDCDPAARQVCVEASFSIEASRDAGLFQFLVRQLTLDPLAASIPLQLKLSYGSEHRVTVAVGDQNFDGLQAQEVLKRIQSSPCTLFHNSTEVTRPYRSRGGFVEIGEVSPDHRKSLADLQTKLARDLAKIAKSQQQELEKLLGRLERRYKVGLSPLPLDLEYLPFRITLGDRKHDVALDDWGSGTRNRTLIIHTLFSAKRVSDSEPSADKVTPIIIIEEPESFLHPSAQAEFGRVLRDLAEEFDVQVIVTSHSPYMLNLAQPSANMLLKRKTHHHQVRETFAMDTAGDDWAEPFAQALGLRSEDLRSWRELFLSSSEAVILVEGPSDREYLELLRDPAHGDQQLRFTGEIVPYEGAGTLQNTALLRFIKNRYKRLFVLYDLDIAKDVERALETVGLERNKQFASVGRNEAGRRSIEGLLPDAISAKVYSEHSDVVSAAVNGTSEERKSARSRLKSLMLAEFKKVAKPGPEFYSRFYPLARLATAALT